MKQPVKVYTRTEVTLVVLSEDSLPASFSLEDIVRECDIGEYVMASLDIKTEKLSESEMDYALYAAGSDPGFFGEEA